MQLRHVIRLIFRYPYIQVPNTLSLLIGCFFFFLQKAAVETVSSDHLICKSHQQQCIQEFGKQIKLLSLRRRNASGISDSRISTLDQFKHFF